MKCEPLKLLAYINSPLIKGSSTEILMNSAWAWSSYISSPSSLNLNSFRQARTFAVTTLRESRVYYEEVLMSDLKTVQRSSLCIIEIIWHLLLNKTEY